MHRLRIALLTMALAAWWAPQTAHAQVTLYDEIVKGEIVGIGIHYGAIRYYNSEAASKATPEVKGFSDILPSTYQGELEAFQVLYKKFIFNFATSNATIRNINQTNAATGFYATKAQRDATQAVISWLYRPFSFGVGTESGTMRIDGPSGHKTFGFDHTFALLEIYIPFPEIKKVEPLIAFGYALPLDLGTGSTRSQTFFNGASFAAIGLVF
jgi:hypothetical protein